MYLYLYLCTGILISSFHMYAAGIEDKYQRKLQEMLLVKGDGETFYPVFKSIKTAFKKNEIYKFRIVTNGEAVPVGSELYLNPPKAN